MSEIPGLPAASLLFPAALPASLLCHTGNYDIITTAGQLPHFNDRGNSAGRWDHVVLVGSFRLHQQWRLRWNDVLGLFGRPLQLQWRSL